jgi:putative proteasome-type protease
MTYCVAIKVNDGLVFAADTRTAAGVDDVRTYNKLHVLEVPGERIFVVLSAGNLATTQYVLAYARREMNDPDVRWSLRTVKHMFDAADYIGQLSVRAQKQATQEGYSGVNVETTLILGGQIRGEDTAIYLIYPLGNCIAASPETPFLQIGEIKYGKPILDRFIRPHVKLEDAARCALVSLDSTMRSNISVGPPVDVAILPRDALAISHSQRLDLDTPYMAQLKETWALQLERGIKALPKFDWELQHSLDLLTPEPLPVLPAPSRQLQSQSFNDNDPGLFEASRPEPIGGAVSVPGSNAPENGATPDTPTSSSQTPVSVVNN